MGIKISNTMIRAGINELKKAYVDDLSAKRTVIAVYKAMRRVRRRSGSHRETGASKTIGRQTCIDAEFGDLLIDSNGRAYRVIKKFGVDNIGVTCLENPGDPETWSGEKLKSSDFDKHSLHLIWKNDGSFVKAQSAASARKGDEQNKMMMRFIANMLMDSFIEDIKKHADKISDNDDKEDPEKPDDGVGRYEPTPDPDEPPGDN